MQLLSFGSNLAVVQYLFTFYVDRELLFSFLTMFDRLLNAFDDSENKVAFRIAFPRSSEAFQQGLLSI